MRSPYCLPPIVIGAVVLVASSFQPVQALSSTEISAIAEAITVRIEGQNPGSGVLIKRQGNIYTVLTAAHVVATEDEYDIVTADGKRYPLDYRRVQRMEGVDLALVEFSSATAYQVADLGDSSTVKSGAAVYVSGFTEPTAAITERILNFSPGAVTANARRPLADGYGLIYTNSTLPGMSGGAVLDEGGKLVGIHGRADTDEQVQVTESIRVKTGFNLAIPINTFTNLVSKVNPSLGFARTTNPVSSSELTADDWFLAAGEKYQKGDNKGAISDYDQAIQLKPDYAEAYNNRGIARSALGDNKGAISDLDKAIQLKPDYAVAYVNRGIARHGLGDHKGAISDYEKSIQLNPKLESSYINLGLIQYESGNIQAASQYWQKAIQINSQRAESKLAMGIAQYIQGNRVQGIALASEALSLDASFASPQVLQKNLWGSQLISDAQKLLQEPEIKRLQF
ncbi:MAG: tetratricopeptide repeat protein [Acaryochloridaceae cyanobacterium CSU_3_4]|nr:tetratricopeptide repeat protein [Acaryochloridaceae cyanobacterium CSU_3_4]